MYEKITNYINAVKSQITVKRFIIGIACVLLAYLIGSLASGYFETRADYKRTFEQLERTQRALDESRKLNQQANSLTATQGTALTELKIINEERTKELNALKAINEKQGQELTKASNLLTTQEAKLNEASTSLSELKAEIKNNKRTEQRLRRQRDTWAASGVLAFIVGAAGAIR